VFNNCYAYGWQLSQKAYVLDNVETVIIWQLSFQTMLERENHSQLRP